uniref:Photosystem I reaction center subunit Nic-like isoform X1 n=1 Tax=Rhizophora mucronata TaxID=61149 RepID=A0A2P2KSD3_RHIMU
MEITLRQDIFDDKRGAKRVLIIIFLIPYVIRDITGASTSLPEKPETCYGKHLGFFALA